MRWASASACLLALGIGLWSLDASGQEEEGPGEGPQVDVEIYQSDKSMAASFDVLVKLTNLHSRRYRIQSVTIRLPDGIENTRDFCAERVHECDAGQTIPHTMDPHTNRFYELPVPRARYGFWQSIFQPEIFLFQPGAYEIGVIVRYATQGSVSGAVRVTKDIQLAPPLSALLGGGVLGAGLLALYLPLYRKARGHPPPPGGRIVSALVTFASGAVVSVITVLMLQRLGELPLPITLEVKDWVGATIVGLFSYKIGDDLYGRFFGAVSSNENGG